MRAGLHPARPKESLPAAAAPQTGSRQVRRLWLALQLLDPAPDAALLDSLADWAEALTPVVVSRPGEGLMLEIQGSLRYFSGLAAIREQLVAELERRGWTARLAVAPTPLAATWLVRCRSVEIMESCMLAGAVGSLPLAATAWPGDVQRLLGQMGLCSIADCLRLPRAGFARRVGREWLADLDRALGRLPDWRAPRRAPQTLRRSVDLAFETNDCAIFAEALRGMTAWFEQELRQRQAQVAEIGLRFRHLRYGDTLTRMRFVEPVHESARMLGPLLARIESLQIAGPAIGLELATGALMPLAARLPALLPAVAGEPAGAAAVSEFALVECLRGRYGSRRVHGIDQVGEHRPEHAWRRSVDPPPAGVGPPAAPLHERPLWLLPEPQKQKRGQSPFSLSRKWCQTPFSAEPRCTGEPERVESGWWDGCEARRDYHVVIGAAGEKLWLYRDCRTHEWYLHGIFG
jgi:protein ImuB